MTTYCLPAVWALNSAFVFCFGLLQDWNIGVGFRPSCKEGVIRFARLCCIVHQDVSTGESKLREGMSRKKELMPGWSTKFSNSAAASAPAPMRR